MSGDKIVQFVSFDTVLDTAAFITQWEKYSRPVNNSAEITLQQSEKKGIFRYLAQYRGDSKEFQFVFSKTARSSNLPEIEVKVKLAGGYSIAHEERKESQYEKGDKVFVFLSNAQEELAFYKTLSPASKLNIYEAYYENCQYAYILEFFVPHKDSLLLLEQLKQREPAEIGIYKECMPVQV